MIGQLGLIPSKEMRNVSRDLVVRVSIGKMPGTREKVLSHLDVAVLQGSQDIVEKPLLIDAVDVNESVRGAQGIIHRDSGLLQFAQIRKRLWPEKLVSNG